VTRYHRKVVIRLLRRRADRRHGRRGGRRVQYGPEVVAVLRAIWAAAGYPWSVRLKALLPLWPPWARRHVRLTDAVEAQVRRISPRQIDRCLRADKRTLRRRQYGRTKPGTLLKHQIPLRTDRWDVQEPGFTEIDLVARSGDRADGEFLHSLSVTDIQDGLKALKAADILESEQFRQAISDWRRKKGVKKSERKRLSAASALIRRFRGLRCFPLRLRSTALPSSPCRVGWLGKPHERRVLE
jgi:hypothetical protein